MPQSHCRGFAASFAHIRLLFLRLTPRSAEAAAYCLALQVSALLDRLALKLVRCNGGAGIRELIPDLPGARIAAERSSVMA